MTNVIFGPRPDDPTLCCHDGHYEGEFYYCGDRALPGGTECAMCLIVRMRRPEPWRRWFGDAA